MPRGFSGVRDASADLESRRGGGGPGALWFRLKPGQEQVIRFLEEDDDVFYCMMHEVPRADRSWGDDVPCLDQEKDGTPCPGCERDLPRRFKGYINVIWFDAPVFKRDDSGKMVKDSTGDPVIISNKPQVAIWSSGIKLFEQLDEINANFKGLCSRKFKAKRKGEGINTTYSIAPEDVDSGPQKMDAEEKKLATEKYDLNEYVKPPSYEEFTKRLGGGFSNGEQSAPNAPRNPFMKSRS